LRFRDSVETLLQLKNPDTGQSLGPGLIAWEESSRRLAVTLGSGYWRWSFMSTGLTGSDDLYWGLVSRTIRWLASAPQMKTVNLSTERKLFSTGEPVLLTAQVLSQDGRAITSAQLEVELRSGEQLSKVLLEPDPLGIYRGTVLPEGIGDYTAIATARMNAEILGVDSAVFTVEAYNLEKETLRQNGELLVEIAVASGGAYLSADSIEKLANMINAPPRQGTMTRSRRFFLDWDLWIILIGSLALEWMIRKRRGML
jgi:hypothetical protein